ncbi:hypothetical protein TRVA0_015S00958 [Trichomonascus vanleenenianus]|uniref:uncharacterized protein n=1 Tax=Trichomonascus vanleenenianus TaxID=2268995 RepID=UPI003ECA5D22
MKFSTLAAAPFIIAIATAQDLFGLIVIRSGSPVQNAPININNNEFHVGSGENFQGFISSEALWARLPDGSQKAVIRDPSTSKLVLDPNPEGRFFSTDGGYLRYNGSEAFTVTPAADGGYTVYTGSRTETGAIPVALRVVPVNSGSSAIVSNNTTVTQTVVPPPATVTNGTVIPTSTVNGTLPITTITETGCPACTQTPVCPGPDCTPSTETSTPSGTSVPGQVNGAASQIVNAAAIIAGVAAAALF